MGQFDLTMVKYFSDKARFADLFNGVFFGGIAVIDAACLTDASERYITEEPPHRATDRLRDIKMQLNTGTALRILAVENQSYIDYTLPLRSMQYDFLEYQKQYRSIAKQNRKLNRLGTADEWLSGMTQSDRLTPVYTLCLYHGEKPWTGPRTLKDMMAFGDEPERMSNLFTDYPLRLYCINEQTDFHMFHTEVCDFSPH